MEDLTLSQRFAVIALDYEPVKRYNAGKFRKVKVLMAAIIIELLEAGAAVKNENGDIIAEDLSAELPEYSRLIYEHIRSNPRGRSLSGWVRYFITQRKLRDSIVGSVTDVLMNKGVMSYGHDIHDSDYNLETSGVEIIVYKSGMDQYSAEVERIRAEFLEDGPVCESTMILAWLLKQCDSLYSIFSEIETDKVNSRMNDFRYKNIYNEILSGARINGGILFSLADNFVKGKRKFFRSKLGRYLKEAQIYSDGRSVSIMLDRYCPTVDESLNTVFKKLTDKGHRCRLINKSVMEVDNRRYLIFLTVKNHIQVARLHHIEE